VPLTGQYGVEGMALSLPAIIGRGGAEQILEIPMADDEVAAFQNSARTLKERLAELPPQA